MRSVFLHVRVHALHRCDASHGIYISEHGKYGFRGHGSSFITAGWLQIAFESLTL